MTGHSSLLQERIEVLEKALRDIATLPNPLPNKASARAQCDYLKSVARKALAS